MTATLSYQVQSVEGDIERRLYAPYIVAEVEVRASHSQEAAELGFRPLAEYIFGKNVPKDKVAMTTPVTAEASGKKIAMTAPVTSSETADGTYTVRFSMPSEWTIQTLPEPVSRQVRLVPFNEHQMLAKKLRGRSDTSRIDAASEELRAYAIENDLKVEGEPVWAGYSAPYVPVPFRRWEMLLKVVEHQTEGEQE